MSMNCSADVTLLVDFGANDNMGGVAASPADFAMADSAVDLAAPVGFFNGDGGGGFNQVGDVVTGSGVDSTGATFTSAITLASLTDISGGTRTGTNGGFGTDTGASFGPPGPGNPISGIVNDYLSINANDNFSIDVDTSAIVAGSVVTVTAYSVGDQTNQVAVLSLTGGGSTQQSGLTSVAQPFQTFTYTQGVGETSLNLEVINNTAALGIEGLGNENQFAVLNGFPITSVATEVVPEPSSLMILALGSLGLVVRRRR